jgi:hypothetical protein
LHHQRKPIVAAAGKEHGAGAGDVRPIDPNSKENTATAAAASPTRDRKQMSDDDDSDDNLAQEDIDDKRRRDEDLTNIKYVISQSNYAQNLDREYFVERSKYCPIRLTLPERKLLRLVEACMTVSEYTDKIDAISAKDRAKRILEQVRNVCSMLSGLTLASDYGEGQQMLDEKDFASKSGFFQDLFEICRRHKIRNPGMSRIHPIS